MDPELHSPNHIMLQHEQTHIKEEYTDRFSLISPPTTPPLLSFSQVGVPATTSRPRGSTFSQAGQHRARPYPPHPLINRTAGTMSNSPGYGTWNPSGARHGHSKSPHVERRSADEDQVYAHPQFMNVSSQLSIHHHYNRTTLCTDAIFNQPRSPVGHEVYFLNLEPDWRHG